MYKTQSNDDFLQYLADFANIDLTSVQKQYEMSKRQKYLKKHTDNYAIYQGNDSAWYTYLLGDSGKRRKVRRVKKEDLENVVIDYYQQHEEDPSIVTLFHKWNDERLHNGDIKKNSHTKYDNDFKRYFLEKDEICSIPISEIKEADLIRFIKLNINRYNLSRKSYESLRTLITGVVPCIQIFMMYFYPVVTLCISPVDVFSCQLRQSL